jgi:hypothetical protein
MICVSRRSHAPRSAAFDRQTWTGAPPPAGSSSMTRARGNQCPPPALVSMKHASTRHGSSVGCCFRRPSRVAMTRRPGAAVQARRTAGLGQRAERTRAAPAEQHRQRGRRRSEHRRRCRWRTDGRAGELNDCGPTPTAPAYLASRSRREATVCGDMPAEATACLDKLDECCSTADCVTGTCFTTPITPYCGGPAPIDYNVCAVDLCENQGDCPGNDSVCIPGPMLGYKVRACIYAQCRHDTDCDAGRAESALRSTNHAGDTTGLYCLPAMAAARRRCPGGYCRPGRARRLPAGPICPAYSEPGNEVVTPSRSARAVTSMSASHAGVAGARRDARIGSGHHARPVGSSSC